MKWSITPIFITVVMIVTVPLYCVTTDNGLVTIDYNQQSVSHFEIGLFKGEQTVPSMILGNDIDTEITVKAEYTGDMLATLILHGPVSLEIHSNTENKTVSFVHLLGEIEIQTFNSYISSKTDIMGVVIENFVSRYNLISLPGGYIYIQVLEGKIGVTRAGNSTILIAGEAMMIEHNSMELTDLLALDLARNRLFSKISINHEKITDSLEQRRLEGIEWLESRYRLLDRQLLKEGIPKSSLLQQFDILQDIKQIWFEQCFIEVVLNNVDYVEKLHEIIDLDRHLWRYIVWHSFYYYRY